MELLSIGLLFLAALNILTYLAFWHDKTQSINGNRRTPPWVLLWMAAFGGSIAAKVAQIRLRHRSRKRHFRPNLNRILILHVLLVALVLAKLAGFFPTVFAS